MAQILVVDDEVGIRELQQPRKFIKVLKPIRVQDGDCWGELAPHSGFHLDVEIDFPSPLIGRQRLALEMSSGAFRNEIARARTFGFMHEVERLREDGLALGGGLDNALVLDEFRLLNADGLRFADEFIRHKLLDAIGDLYLLGRPLLGAFTAHKSGHALNNQLLRALVSDTSAWEMASFEHAAQAPAGIAGLVRLPA